MKKYMFVLLVLAIACAFSISSVIAADLEKYDFDGKFTMEMDKGLDFQRSELSEGVVNFMDPSKVCSVMYMEGPQINSTFAEDFYKSFENEGYNSTSTEGNITIFEKDYAFLAVLYKDGILVVSTNANKDKAVDALKTIKFS